jgi:hypothetical protein
VTILRREPASDPADPDGLRPALAVVYSTPTRGPRRIFIPGADLSDDDVAQAIRRDLASLNASPPSTLEI